MRAHDNWALFYAQYEAQRLRLPLIVFYGLTPAFLDASLRHYVFMIEGLKDVEQILGSRSIGFIVRPGDLPGTLLEAAERLRPALIVCDYSPLRNPRISRSKAAKSLGCPLIEVDAHNIIPAWQASDSEESSLGSMRRKIALHLDEFLVSFPRLNRHPYSPPKIKPVNWDRLISTLNVREAGLEISKRSSGLNAAKHTLKSFVINRLVDYAGKHNDPNANGQSGLSPYINFGQLSAQRVALELVEARLAHKSLWEPSKDFIDALIVHRELAENFCEYNRFYDKIEGFPKWARDSMEAHTKDPRAHVYTLRDFENGATHDPLWNAAHKQMVNTGMMHGYLRIYWAKKILEWSRNPETALQTAIALNNRYSLDGRDPAGYAGIAWCIGGVHDRPCQERPIFGLVRYLDLARFRRSFDADAFIAKFT